MKRHPMSTLEELGAYLKRLAWARYRAWDSRLLECLPLPSAGPLSPAEVRSAIALVDQAMRCRFLQERHHYEDQVLR